jgi:hypothetical protein
MYATYLRLDLHVFAGWRAVVRSAATKLRRDARSDLEKREARKQFYREMLSHHRDAQHIVHRFRL